MSTGLNKLVLAGKDPSADATYPPILASNIAHVEIFPRMGIARFGDSEKEYFLAPELPGSTDLPAGITKFRDPDQRIRPQAVRFRVYAYDADHKLLGEINDKVAIEDGSQEKYTLKWTVHVANKKAAYTGFQGRYTNPPITALRNPEVQKNIDLDLRDKLIVDPKPQSIPTSDRTDFVNLEGGFYGSKEAPTPVSLGQLQADNAGRVIFIAGSGYSQCIANPDNSQPEVVSEFDGVDWIDTGCDGWVRVQVTAAGFDKKSDYAATVISAPPNFAWGINSPTTLYDIMEDIYWRKGKQPSVQMIEDLEYDFDKDIWPVLQAAALSSWTNNFALQGHGPSSNGDFLSKKVIDILKGDDEVARITLKTRIFEKLRKPDYEDPSQSDARYMPRLSGDSGDMPDPGEVPYRLQPDIKRFAALTKLQYERFRAWKDDNGPLISWPPAPKENIEGITLGLQPEYLTRASLESTIGDPLFPGIEVYWVAKELSTYDLRDSKLEPPFRVNYPPEDGVVPPKVPFVTPGYLTRGLSLPWQSDFVLCSVHWWPAIRPDDVVTKVAYDNIMGKSGTPEQFETAATTRRDWIRGFRETLDLGQTRASTDIPWYSSTDMVRYWSYLGVIRKYEKEYRGETRTAYVESERLEI